MQNSGAIDFKIDNLSKIPESYNYIEIAILGRRWFSLPGNDIQAN
jgi:hypothetical protein